MCNFHCFVLFINCTPIEKNVEKVSARAKLHHPNRSCTKRNSRTGHLQWWPDSSEQSCRYKLRPSKHHHDAFATICRAHHVLIETEAPTLSHDVRSQCRRDQWQHDGVCFHAAPTLVEGRWRGFGLQKGSFEHFCSDFLCR